MKETNLLAYEQIKTYLTEGVFPFILGFFIGILELIIWTLKHKYNISWLPSNLTKTLFIEHMPVTTIMLFVAITLVLLSLSILTKNNIKCLSNISQTSLAKLKDFTSFSSWVIFGVSSVILIVFLFIDMPQTSSAGTIFVTGLFSGVILAIYPYVLKFFYNIGQDRKASFKSKLFLSLLLLCLAIFIVISTSSKLNRTLELNFSNEEMNKIEYYSLSNNKTSEDFIKSIVIEKITKKALEK